MKILIVHPARIPVFAYGGTERVVWDLGKALTELGHQVTYLVAAGSHCDFATIIECDPQQDIMAQIPSGFDIVHFQASPHVEPDFPYLVTEHGNSKKKILFPPNTVFISKNHADRYRAKHYVYNGLDWREYPDAKPYLGRPYRANDLAYWHFLGKGSWPVKNLKGAISVALRAGTRLDVMGAKRLNLSRGFRFTLSPRVRFHGMVGGQIKHDVLSHSDGMIFPVRWHEPFGLAIIESLYFGCPILSTPYGSLPEIVTPEVGFLAASAQELAQACIGADWDRSACHERATTLFNHEAMGRSYESLYERVISGERLNESWVSLDHNGHMLLPWEA